ncbi:MAG: Imm26 family immunity protein, partial [Candidatus Eremiobacterota bacterium]
MFPSLFVQQHPYKKKLRPGDVFSIKLRNGRFLHGIIISANSSTSILIHILKGLSSDAQEYSDLKKENVLIEPLITNRQGWLMGFFVVVDHVELDSTVRFDKYCFRVGMRYVDENGYPTTRSEPCGDQGLHSVAAIE